ncbi:conserved hypothetical protein [Neospora caninum Liverpool]|uniref:U3 small nucleolar RNA-associated protein 18 homolog n=1 Tax=Neospora caninum (strain Liverpool) TaxID=572307 RepID=F0VC10_NEOCL|nr:conserved hypothetical protein [Neospora caninum Liverpool]CBZ51144.1 conserved hypothetical protein [Neospora caninum Liverpool]CEL68453.1 TPA: U3 small nucleolar RNA-associated protein 18 homolog [Neospora caninum Liverpool]|eukprot:XP_003881177.1 conserved hypothetical protein [Neospora caninum Liverpool]
MARPKPASARKRESEEQKQKRDTREEKEGKRFFSTDRPDDAEAPVASDLDDKRKTKRAKVGKTDPLSPGAAGVHTPHETARRHKAVASASHNASALVSDEVRALERLLFGSKCRRDGAGANEEPRGEGQEAATQKRKKSAGQVSAGRGGRSKQSTADPEGAAEGAAGEGVQPRKKKRHENQRGEMNGEASARPAALESPHEQTGRKRNKQAATQREDDAESGEEKEGEEHSGEEERDGQRERRRAWVDPDDAQLAVNIRTNRKLRKLRENEQEETLSGEAFQKRLAVLHRRLVQSRASMNWVEKARQRKRDAQAAREAQQREAGDSDVSDDPSTLQLTRTGQTVAGIHSASSVLSSKGLLRRLARERTGPLVFAETAGRARIPQKKVIIRRLANANEAEPSASVISALEFHPRTALLMTAGRDQTMRLFSIDGKENRKVESIFFRDFPVLAARFTRHNTGGQVLAISNANRSLAEYDLETGQVNKIPGIAGRRQERCYHFLEMGGGRGADDAASFLVTQKTFALASANSQDVLLCDVRSKRLLNVFSMNATVAAIAYHPTKEAIFTADREAFIYEWDLRSGNCVAKFQDPSCLRLSAMAASPAACLSPSYEPSPFLATGSRTGYVDFFSLSSDSVATKPVKEMGNLTTEISTLAFHPSNQLICVASRWKKDALRLVHLPSLTVYQNWPTERTPLRYVTAADFSCDNGFLAVGNDRGNALLYQIRHFA